MKNRSLLRVMGVLLLAALLCLMAPAAFAEGPSARGHRARPAIDRDMDCLLAHADEMKTMREDALSRYLCRLFEAEETDDPVLQARLMAEADRCWCLYTDLISVQSRLGEPGGEDPYASSAPEETPSDNAEDEARWERYFQMNFCGRTSQGSPREGEWTQPGECPFGRVSGSARHEGGRQDRYLPDRPGETAQTEDALPEEADDYDVFLTGWERLQAFLARGQEESAPAAEPAQPMVGLANPWTLTGSPDKAAGISGVRASFPAAEALPAGMELLFYRAMEGTAEADYSDGDRELMLRASTDQEGLALSGDYNVYSKQWQTVIDGLEVDCLGDGETVNVATFKTGGVAFAVNMAGGREGDGLTPDELRSIVTGFTAEAVRTADKPDLYAGIEWPEDGETPADDAKPAEKNGEIYILYTSDIHCGVDKGFGMAGLKAVRDSLEAQGYTTILVDDGDQVQGEPMGTLSKGEDMIELMNAMHYDVAIPGNHDFDYGMDQFMKLVGEADFPYVSCNFNREGELVFPPYVMIEAAGRKIAFVGVTTPESLTTTTPSYFQDESGTYIYGFMQDKTGEKLYSAVQSAVDDARAAGADYVYVLGHLGNEEECRPWTYADVIANTTGIDVFFDGHSHDTDQVVMKNKEGKDVPRSACGTKLNCIGYSHIDASGKIVATGIWSWPNTDCAADLLGLDNELSQLVKAGREKLSGELDTVVAHTDVALTITDPEEKDSADQPLRMVRRAETNLGDLCADAYRVLGQADIGFINGGGIRTGIAVGDITNGDILAVHPFGNWLSVVQVTGQQLLDALEWGCRALPDEAGAFPQVSGMSFEIHSYIASGCTADEDNMFAGIQGERRVKNVMVGDEPLDPAKTYTVAGNSFMLLKNGDGYPTCLGGTALLEQVMLDNQMLIEYIVDDLHGEVGEDYADPHGQGRIVIVDTAPAGEATAQSDNVVKPDKPLAA